MSNVLFYKPLYYVEHPAEIIQIWGGGMSFHGGLIGVILAIVWISHARKKRLLSVRMCKPSTTRARPSS